VSADVVVWNTDVRNRPELEVEIDIVTPPSAVPGEYYARSQPALEVELMVVEQLELPPERGERLFCAADLAQWSFDGIIATEDVQLVYDPPPPGYRTAYAHA
jgi:hypothetical protein